ncbi:glycoside hydrolase family 32 protein [Yunchengibacter salinarum]|uniref:glycoside hydrolase family 32 protein n=1 Tax=Yunchengibacter salinarum TaxID=3133399 RepID=UPI0035B6A1C0
MKQACAALLLAATAFTGPASVAAADPVPEKARDSGPATQHWRPGFHFTPARHWMNDPNGLVWQDGTYHLFYQHNPEGIRWGHMSWGHATSDNLLDWDEKAIALPETDDHMAFSGSAVVDHDNTSGFGSADNPPLVAIYTAYDPETKAQRQHLAYSLDKGETWARHAGNPVLDIGSREFRDPKVFWHDESDRWVMAVAKAKAHKIAFYSSPDLKDWTHLSDFGPMGSTGGVWECPDLFRVPVDGGPETRWVLQVDLGRGAPAGGSGGMAFVGDFDGTRFTPDPAYADGPAHFVDYGADFYAAQSFSGAPSPDGKRLWLAWFADWRYAQDMPTRPWRGAMTLARRVDLTERDGIPVLRQTPLLPEGRDRRGEARSVTGRQPLMVAGEAVSGRQMVVSLTLDPGAATDSGIAVYAGAGVETRIGYDARGETLYVDRRRSGPAHNAVMAEHFPARHSAPLASGQTPIDLTLVLDNSTLEVFAEDGTLVFSERVFAPASADGMFLYAKGGVARVSGLTVRAPGEGKPAGR